MSPRKRRPPPLRLEGLNAAKASSLLSFLELSKVTGTCFRNAVTIPRPPLMVRRLNMNPLRYAFLQLMFWAFELKLWTEGLPWEQVRIIVAERSKELARAAYETS